MQQIAVNKQFALKILVVIAAAMTIFFGTEKSFAQEKNQPKQYQIPTQPSGEQPNANSNLIISPNEDYLIGKSDVLEIKVEDAPELSGVYRLNSDGTFRLPVVGQISAKDKRTEDVAAMIADKLRGGYLVNPIVTVAVRQSNSRAFFIQGAVRRPGIYHIEGHPSLLKLITIAGGLADNYGSTAFIMREKPAGEIADSEQKAGGANEKETATIRTVSNDPTNNKSGDAADTSENDDKAAENGDKYNLLTANINNLLRGNLDQNVTIEPGDIVHIPQTDVFFVAGEVKAPGSFPLKDGTTLRQAISLAQGTKFEGAADRGVIFREDRSGKRREIPVNISAVMSGKKDDVDILPNDIIIVPNSKTKSVTKSILQGFSGGIPSLLLRGY